MDATTRIIFAAICLAAFLIIFAVLGIVYTIDKATEKLIRRCKDARRTPGTDRNGGGITGTNT